MWHGKTALKWLKNNHRFIIASVGHDTYRVQVRDHRWELRYGLRLKHEVYLATLPAHYNGWICIHNGEASWTDDGSPYYGGLQMSEGWMGVVYHANLLSPLVQMQLAERVSALHGFTYAFMHQQWPNTFPPCSGYF